MVSTTIKGLFGIDELSVEISFTNGEKTVFKNAVSTSADEDFVTFVEKDVQSAITINKHNVNYIKFILKGDETI